MLIPSASASASPRQQPFRILLVQLEQVLHALGIAGEGLRAAALGSFLPDRGDPKVTERINGQEAEEGGPLPLVLHAHLLHREIETTEDLRHWNVQVQHLCGDDLTSRTESRNALRITTIRGKHVADTSRRLRLCEQLHIVQHNVAILLLTVPTRTQENVHQRACATGMVHIEREQTQVPYGQLIESAFHSPFGDHDRAQVHGHLPGKQFAEPGLCVGVERLIRLHQPDQEAGVHQYAMYGLKPRTRP